jgi:mannonate dehydratase
VDADVMRENLHYFLNQIIPVAEAEGIKMAIHPDDPPFSLLGLPRVVSTLADLKAITKMVDSPSNGITFCSGSLGARIDNEVITIAIEMAHRVNFIHLRNIKHLEQNTFMEADHLNGHVNLKKLMQLLIEEQHRRTGQNKLNVDIPMRPDHGFRMLDDFSRETYPGYSSIGRLKALAQLEGLEKGLREE